MEIGYRQHFASKMPGEREQPNLVLFQKLGISDENRCETDVAEPEDNGEDPRDWISPEEMRSFLEFRRAKRRQQAQEFQELMRFSPVPLGDEMTNKRREDEIISFLEKKAQEKASRLRCKEAAMEKSGGTKWC